MELTYTFKSHRGPMLFVVMSSSREQCYSGGTDRLIQGWTTTNLGHPYDSYSPSCCRPPCWATVMLCGAWPKRLLSYSEDIMLRLWSTSEVVPALKNWPS